MRSITLNFQTGAIDVVHTPTPMVRPRTLLVANHHSLISAGTEGHVIQMARKGPIGKALDRPDLARQVINKALTEGIVGTAKVVRNLIATPHQPAELGDIGGKDRRQPAFDSRLRHAPFSRSGSAGT